MHLRDLVQFLGELSENNNRAWFVMNKPRYDILRLEFLELVTQLIADVSKFDPAVAGISPKKALFRIHRDLRFSADKSPYKTRFSAAITANTATALKLPSHGGKPEYYFQIDATGRLIIAGGEYTPPADRLRAIRQQVVADPDGFTKLIRDKKMKARFGGLQEEGKLTRPPKGFDADVPHIEYVKLRSFIVWNETNLTGKLPADLGGDIADAFRDVKPLIDWLRKI